MLTQEPSPEAQKEWMLIGLLQLGTQVIRQMNDITCDGTFWHAKPYTRELIAKVLVKELGFKTYEIAEDQGHHYSTIEALGFVTEFLIYYSEQPLKTKRLNHVLGENSPLSSWRLILRR